mmetsp:Transcript_15007/g.20373  ORF Transcript_15007/g.20373 Transcript_15007/m.20373 type:complete len:109 (-) Transcript_15007:1228-1554(-)|eukprot:CAMPEP_0185587462 /NCGR_PEP_ID=MMETSP0434-20130131/49240_1 /TAXON_ID=626734 ORGANISM="Favella taraikaensis, Strain Fe Narragansett Bay" /NCGR_SAMPLE_ID=MMETSP0434 /ASSEMBLY_ACC=CAM_ASM_000379 /LENGTH=108 /DNA_ID=CAMNT_0028209365 /DNA_START=185 /DNA_END=511 /DNA_ORIENTATION=-
MENQLVNDFGIDLLIAQYALVSTEYTGVDAAMDFIFGEGDGDVLKHRFFGYVPSDYQGPKAADPETGEVYERCYICEKLEACHKVDSARQVLDNHEENFMSLFGSEEL